VSAEEAERIRANPFYQALAETFSGTQEYVAMEKIGELNRMTSGEGRWDLIVVDTPPSASALDFLDGPNRLEALAHNPLLKVVLGLPRGPFGFLDAGAALATKALDTILGGRLFADLRTFLQVFERAVLAFESNAAETRRLLASEATAFVAVAAPRPAPVAEAVALMQRLIADGLPLRGLVVNQVSPVVDVAADVLAAAELAADQPQRDVLAHHRRNLARAQAERRAIEPLMRFPVPTTLIARQQGGVNDVESLTALLGGFEQQASPGGDV
jgi:anion-transporting  ArsA/GET3 family ATPase